MVKNLKYSLHRNGILLIIILLIAPGITKGQFNFREGFVVTQTRDTLFGLLYDGGALFNSGTCLFRMDKKQPKIRYQPDDIISYGFNGDKYYSSFELFVKDEFKTVFTEVLLEGNINLYYYRYDKEKSYYIKDENGRLVSLVNRKVEIPISSESLFSLQNNTANVPVSSEKFSNQMKSSIYIDDYKDTLFTIFNKSEQAISKLENIRYTQKDIQGLVKDYIGETCGTGNCINYVRDLKIYRPRFGIYSGVQISRINFLDSDAESGILTSVPVGIFCNFPLQLVNDRLSFQVEVNTTTLNYSQQFAGISDTLDFMGISSMSFGIPVLFRYEFPGRRFYFSFAAGKETRFITKSNATINLNEDFFLHHRTAGGWFIEPGLNLKISKSLSFYTNVRLQKNRNLVVPEQYRSKLTYSQVEYHENYSKRYQTEILNIYCGIKF